MFCAALSLSSVAYAAVSQSGIKVGLAGLENHNSSFYIGKTVYIAITPNPNNCLYGGVYFFDEKDLNRVLSVAMTAKALGKTVRIDFNQPGGVGTLCSGYSIYLE